MSLHRMFGFHSLFTFRNCNSIILVDIDILRRRLPEILKKSGCNIISVQDHVFDDNGYTCVFLLEESHCSFHTYPESMYSVFIDFFTCGTQSNHTMFRLELIKLFDPKQIDFQTLIRD